MKTLVTFMLTFGETYAKSCPVTSAISGEENQPEEPFDWREDLRKYAEATGYALKESDLETVESMLDFMIVNSPFFKNCIRRSDVQLPGGAVLVDSIANGVQEPIMLIWEEDVVSKCCFNCCKLHRRECTGKNRSQLIFALNAKEPDCFEKCPEDSCLYGPGLCDRAFEEIPDGFAVEV